MYVTYKPHGICNGSTKQSCMLGLLKILLRYIKTAPLQNVLCPSLKRSSTMFDYEPPAPIIIISAWYLVSVHNYYMGMDKLNLKFISAGGN